MMDLGMAWAQSSAQPPAGVGLILQFVPFIGIFVLFYFLLVRPQQQRNKARRLMIENLKKGERVLTTGGLIGTLTHLSTDIVTLQIAEGVRVKIKRSYVEEVQKQDLTEETEK